MGSIREDPGLTELGKHQCERLAARFAHMKKPFHAVFTSDLRRATQSADIVCRGLDFPKRKVKADVRLREIDHGDWDGAIKADVITEQVKRAIAERGYDFAAPGGESYRRVSLRVGAWLIEEIMDSKEFAKRSHTRILMCSHEHTIQCLLQMLVGVDMVTAKRMKLRNGSVTHLRFCPDGWHFPRLGCTEHLAPSY